MMISKCRIAKLIEKENEYYSHVSTKTIFSFLETFFLNRVVPHVRIFPFKKIVVKARFIFLFLKSDRGRNDDNFEAWDSKVNKEKEYYFHVSTKTIFSFLETFFLNRVVPHVRIFPFKKIVVKAQFIFLFLKSDRGRNDADFEA